MKKVACVGIAVVDLIFTLDELPHTGGKNYANSLQQVGGGIAANAAATVASLGGDAWYIGAVGRDSLGDEVLAGLEAAGVNVTATQRVDAPTSVSAVVVDARGERMIINYTSPDLFANCPNPAASAYEGAGAVLADVRWLSAATAALAWAERAGVPGVLDLDRPLPEWRDLAAGASHVAASQEALAGVVGASEPEQGLRAMRKETTAWLAVTAGAEGVYWLEGEEVRHQPAFPVAAVDTVGAGDVFHGALTLALAEGRSEEEAITWASAAAALKCSRPGGRAGIPTRTELDRFLEAQA